ncbi:MAG: tryptophan-rich sensory protein [Xanthomonadales bacterium]|jgi:benzodiazapine receptor|nr:tryptophan-rich sensory protein [Xanthomonadales bacterium]
MNHRPPVVLPEIAARPREGWFALLGWILLLVGLGALAGVLFAPNGWYAALLKPTWNPPSWVFGPVWTLLYTIMAVALWLVRRELDADDVLRQRAVALFAIQFLLNLAWTPLFFGLHSPGLAFAEICLLWIALLSTMLTFGRVNALAGYLLLPYLLWVSFALVLNGTIWLMNS